MEQTWVQHFIELRRRLLFIALGFGLAFLALFPFTNNTYQLLAAPLTKFMSGQATLIATDITSPFLVPVKLSALLALIISLPNTCYQIWQFIVPGLYRHERQLIVKVTISCCLLFLGGMAFCYFLVLPTIFKFIVGFKAPSIAMLTDIDKYLSFVLSLFLIFGLAFEMPVIIFLLIYLNIVAIDKARQIRKFMLVGCFIIAAIVTPPDVLSQTLLAIPLYLLYELGILAAAISQRRKLTYPPKPTS